MENDDRPVGRVLSRREVLTLFGTTGAALLAACSGIVKETPTSTNAPQSTPPTTNQAGANAVMPSVVPTLAPATLIAPTNTSQPLAGTTQTAAIPATGGQVMCVARPEQTEGPYFRDEKLNRSDIRSDPASGTVKEGVLLRLTLRVSQVTAGACTPLPGATVDIWHCDAQGVYSDVSDPGFNSAGQKFLRGYQVTSASGLVTFVTIYPGWYPGRTVHIHFKIRTNPDAQTGHEFTSQLYFDDGLNDQVFAQPPYSGRGQRRTRNTNDGVYRSGGDQLLLQVTNNPDGYAATFDIGLQIT